MQDDIPSPVTGGPTFHIASFDVEKIISAYSSQYKCDVRRFFPFATIHLRECSDTSYQFFFPFTCVGDPAFYANLYPSRAQSASFYPDSRWDFEWVIARLASPSSVLDVGCGGGAFLNLTRSRGWGETLHGLETSEFGRQLAEVAGLTVTAVDLTEYAAIAATRYTVVTAFQVLEHVCDVQSFMVSCATLLESGGYLVVSVPNNDSFVGSDPLLTLNMPPHHMGRWRPESLRRLSGRFGLELVDFAIEPLQPNNFGWYRATKERSLLRSRSRLFKAMYYRLGGSRLFSEFVADGAKEIAGHTMLAVFRKL